MRTVTRITPTKPQIAARKKVAAYARISMETERMNHSLSAQISYYNQLIQQNPEWEFAGVYSDDGISGTSIKKRQAFQQMIADCEAGKIDIILTKSIQRFARNTVDLLKTVRHLKNLGVEVRFEKENISSLSGDGELMLSILASFAQEESHSISENVKWATRKRFEQGIPNGKFRIYGYRWAEDKLVIVPEEAKVVRRIYQNFLDGKSRLETERELEAEGIRTRQGCVMRDSNIKGILTNVTYTGNMLFQKEYVESPIDGKRKKNRGEKPQYWVENTHEPIIDMATFQYVQDEMARRRKLGALANKSLNTSCFTGKLKCPYCKQSYMHMQRKKNGYEHEYWVCGSRKKKKVGAGCPVGGTISATSLKRVCAEVLGLGELSDTVFLEQVERIEVPRKYTLVFYMKDGRTIEKPCPNTGHKDCWTPELRAKTSAQRLANPTTASSVLTGKIRCSDCDCNYRTHVQPSPVAKGGKIRHWRCSKHGSDCHSTSLRDDAVKELIARTMGWDKFTDKAFKQHVDYIVVKNQDLEIHCKEGSIKTATYIPPARIGHKWSKAQHAKFKKSMKNRYTPERREKMSEYMKQLRRERGDRWRKEK